MNIQTLLENYGLSYKDFRGDEKEELIRMVSQTEAQNITLNDFLEHLTKLIAVVEDELTSYEPKTILELLWRKKRRNALDARLRCYVLMRNFIVAPIKAREAISRAIEKVAESKLEEQYNK
jgi:hypothetical protein